jgi:hypothetical protein
MSIPASSTLRLVGFIRGVGRAAPALAMLLLLASSSWAFEVAIDVGVPVGYEPSNVGEVPAAPAVPATFIVRRQSGNSGDLAVVIKLTDASTATLTTDFTATYFDSATPGGLATTLTFSGPGNTDTVNFHSGESELTIYITPVADTLIEARESVAISIEDPAVAGSYITGTPSTMSVSIADNDHSVRIEIPDSVADEDPALFGLANDPDIRRRAVMRARFDQWPGSALPYAAPSGSDKPFDRNFAAVFSGAAALGADYSITYKICGNKNALTMESSRIGYDPVNKQGTGIGYTMIAHLAGEVNIVMSGAPAGSSALGAGSKIRFANDLATQYTVLVDSSNNLVTLSVPLVNNLPNGTAIQVSLFVPPANAAVGATAPTTLVVDRVYPAGSTTINVDFGSGGLYEGDVFQIGTDPGLFVVTADTPALTTGAGRASGALTFRRFQGVGSGAGLTADLGGSPLLVTLISPPLSGSLMQLLVPMESTKVEVSIAPTLAGDGAEGREDVRMTIIASEDYQIRTPQVGSVLIADRDVSASVSVRAGEVAGLPNVTGYFTLSLDRAFPVAINVPFSVTTSLGATEEPLPVPAIRTDTFAHLPRSVTFVAGQREARIQVDPISGGVPGAVTVTLNGTLDYKLASSPASGLNPSATMNISDSAGSVNIAATTPTAVESATRPPAVDGLFTVTLARSAGQSGSIGVNLAVSGTAVVGSRYEFYNPLNAATYPVSGGQVQIVIPAIPSVPPVVAGTLTSVTIGVRPINNFLADGNQSVQLALLTGQSYVVNPAAVPVSVTVQDDEPTISVNGGVDAVRPSTPGSFTFSYPGVPSGTALGQSVVVHFSYSGTGVLGTDFSDSASGSSSTDRTVTINAGSRSAVLSINPIDTADGAAKDITVTILSNTTYNIGTASDNIAIGASNSPSANKPTPGVVNTGSSGGSGCGLGSGIATFSALLLLALRMALVRRRRDD